MPFTEAPPRRRRNLLPYSYAEIYEFQRRQRQADLDAVYRKIRELREGRS